MDKIVIDGGLALLGSATVSGAKNAERLERELAPLGAGLRRAEA